MIRPYLPVPGAPAFLDALDEIRVWLPESAHPKALAGKFRAQVNGHAIAVIGVQGSDKVMPVRDPNRVVLAGTLQKALGGQEWNPAGSETQMTRLSESRFELVAKLPAGSYAYKLTRGGSWDENYGAGFVAGGANLTLLLSQEQLVRFVVDFAQKTIADSVNQPEIVAAPTALPARLKPTETDTKYQSFRLKLARKLTALEVAQPIQAQFDSEPWRTVYVREALSDSIFHYAPACGLRCPLEPRTNHVSSEHPRASAACSHLRAHGERSRVSAQRRSGGRLVAADLSGTAWK